MATRTPAKATRSWNMKATTRHSAMAHSWSGVIPRNAMSCGRNSRRIERKSAKQPEKNKAKAVNWSRGRPSATTASRRLGFCVDTGLGSADLVGAVLRPPSGAEVPGGVRPVREPERKPAAEETVGNHAAALQEQLGFGLHEDGAHFQHESACRQSDADSPRTPQRGHEITVRKRIGPSESHGSGHLARAQQPVAGATEVLVGDPGDVLLAVARRAAETRSHEPQDRVEDAAAVRAQDDRRPQLDLPSAGNHRLVER